MTESTTAVCESLAAALDAGDGLWETTCPNFDAAALPGLVGTYGFKVREGNEGAVSSVDSAGTRGDFSRTGLDFDFHTDGLYQDPVPDIVSLFCVDPGRGESSTLLSDGYAVLESFAQADLEFAMMLSCVYIGRHGDQFSRPLVVEHPRLKKLTIQTASRGYLRPAGLIPSQGGHMTIRDISRFTGALLSALEEHVVMVKDWQPNDLLIFDNYRFPHARRSSTGVVDSGRLLYRTWFDYV